MRIVLLSLGILAFMAGQSCAWAVDKAPVAKTEFWTKRCSPQNGRNYCEIFQRLSVQQKNQKTAVRILEFAVGYPTDGKGQAKGVLITPLGISLDSPIRVQVGGSANNGFTAKPRMCESDGCYAMFDLTPALITQMNSNDKMTVTLPSPAGKNIAIIMSLIGFGSALTAIKP